ncbi:hypothetical protein [Nocardia abscessus]|uniref:hypothetical protein n=1 Tax=Nocardia abscessus TaxID=120957 RepID=UPI002454CABC|nr:hypothetical protein [Nocardia abscessus]
MTGLEHHGARRRRRRAVCGTEGGYHRHYRLKESPCDACRTAHAATNRAVRARGDLPGTLRIDSLLFAAMYLETSPERQVDAEAAIGRDTLDLLVAALDRLAS